MNFYESIQWAIVVFNSVILFAVCLNLIIGKATWAHWAVRLGVLVAAAGLGGQIIYSLKVLSVHQVPEIAPWWMLKDVGIGILFLLDMLIPSVYWTGGEP